MGFVNKKNLATYLSFFSFIAVSGIGWLLTVYEAPVSVSVDFNELETALSTTLLKKEVTYQIDTDNNKQIIDMLIQIQSSGYTEFKELKTGKDSSQSAHLSMTRNPDSNKFEFKIEGQSAHIKVPTKLAGSMLSDFESVLKRVLEYMGLYYEKTGETFKIGDLEYERDGNQSTRLRINKLKQLSVQLLSPSRDPVIPASVTSAFENLVSNPLNFSIEYSHVYLSKKTVNRITEEDTENKRTIIHADKLFEYIQKVDTSHLSINSIVQEEPIVPFMFYLIDGYNFSTPLYFHRTGAVYDSLYKEEYGAFLIVNAQITKEAVEKAVSAALRKKLSIDLNEELSLFALKRKSKVVFADKGEIERYYKNQLVALCKRNAQILEMIATLVHSSEDLIVKVEFLESLNSMNEELLSFLRSIKSRGFKQSLLSALNLNSRLESILSSKKLETMSFFSNEFKIGVYLPLFFPIMGIILFKGFELLKYYKLNVKGKAKAD